MRALIVLLVSLAACTPPVVPSPPDAMDANPAFDSPPMFDARGDDADRACANLQTLGCAGGQSANCATVLRHAIGTNLVAGLTPASVRCVASAASRADVAACSSFFACSP